MCPNVVKMEYIEGSNRFDGRTHVMLERLLKHGEIIDKPKEITESYVNVCYLNETRRKVNKECSERFIKEFNCKFIDVGGVKFGIGMPVICNENMKNFGMYNSQLFSINNVTKDIVIINNISFSINQFTGKKPTFELGFCITVYKYQGDTIREKYNIYDSSQMCRKELYTALSRTTKFENIHMVNPNKIYGYKGRSFTHVKPYMDKEYKNGKIYFIKFIDGIEKFYIGSTTKELNDRLNQHQNNPKSPIYKRVAEIHLLSRTPCLSKKELEGIEGKFINRYPGCINKRMVEKVVEPVTFKAEINNLDNYKTKLLEKYKINKLEGYFRIRYKVDSKYKIIKRRYNDNNVKAVHETMIEIRDKLVEEEMKFLDWDKKHVTRHA